MLIEALRRGHSAAYCAIGTKCGTRSEGSFPEGTAHFIEHTLFKGTSDKSAAVINSCLDKLGGELNAYTTKEEIILHATVLKEDIWKAVGLLLDLASRANFPEKEIETERGVILDEIISYKDSPADDLYDNFESRIYRGHPLGRNVLGTEESVKDITRDDLVAFYGKFFRQENMVLTIVADMDAEEMKKKASALAAAYFPDFSSRPIPDLWEKTAPVKVCASFREDHDNHEANAVIGGYAPSLYDRDRIAAVLLGNILAGPASNSLMNAELREKKGWVYATDCSYTQYSDSGVLAISLGCDTVNLKKCLRAAFRIIERMKNSPMSDSGLKAAKKQLIASLAIGGENGETQCLSMCKSLLSFGRVLPDSESRALIEAVTADDLRRTAALIFDDALTSTAIYE